MKKEIRDLTVAAVQRLGDRYVHLRLTDRERALPANIAPGQFVQVRIDDTPSVFLRRPISVNYVDYAAQELWLLVAVVGDGTRRLAALRPGDRLNCVLPLGRGFTFDATHDRQVLLVGGGVGVAPLLWAGRQLRDAGVEPCFLLGARTAGDLPMAEHFERLGRLCVTTEDGSLGEQGYVTQHSLLADASTGFDRILCCGPTPMMRAVARYARQQQIDCQVSLENLMACGLGACLCCVQEVDTQHVCVCQEGPVFNINQLPWQD